MSPAPVVSTLFAGMASIRITRLPDFIREPCAPSFTTAMLQISAISDNASSGSLPVNDIASSSLANTISTYCLTIRFKKSRLAATILKLAISIEIRSPFSWAVFMAASMREWF